MAEQRTLLRIEPFRFATVMMLITAVTLFISCFLFLAQMGSALSQSGAVDLPTTVLGALGFSLLITVIYMPIGWLAFAIDAWLFNVIAPLVGGIHFVSGLPTAAPPTREKRLSGDDLAVAQSGSKEEVLADKETLDSHRIQSVIRSPPRGILSSRGPSHFLLMVKPSDLTRAHAALSEEEKPPAPEVQDAENLEFSQTDPVCPACGEDTDGAVNCPGCGLFLNPVIE